MLNTYTYVQGEEQMQKLLKKMGRDKAVFCESFAHSGNITIERIYERINNEGPYTEFCILYMPHENGKWHMDIIRTMVHNDIKEGAKACKRV